MDQDHPSTDDRMSRTRGRIGLEAAGIVALALALNLAGNDRVGLWDRDEPRYAACTREMRERGDWLHPTFNGQPRYHKPILIYWLMRAGYAVGGDNPFGARLVSAVAGAMTCLLAWRLGRSIVGPEAGLLGALALATVPIMVAESKLATTDATLALLVVLAQGCLWGLSRRDSRALAGGFWLAMGLATLLKGPVGPALVAASGVASWWWGGPTACWRRLHWRSGLLIFLAVTAPWFVAVGVVSRGEFFRFAFRTQIVQRISTGMEQHGGFPGYYPVAALAMFYPWSTLLPAALLEGWRRRRSSPEFGFLLGWIVGPCLLLECFQTKLVHYYLPSFPACALLVAWLVVEIARRGSPIRDWPLGYVALKLLGGMALLATVGLVVGGFIAPRPLLGPCLAMALVLAIGSSFARASLAKGRSMRAARGLVGTWAMVMGLFVAWFLPSAEPFRFSRLVGERLGELSSRTGVRPAMMTFQEPGLVYALGHPACDVRGYDEMAEEVRERGPILVPLLAKEVVEMRDDPRFALSVVEPISGFNVNKGKVQELTFTVVGASSRLASSRSGEQPLVK
jgi:4-amino-4-deoxy-L-arabinose transferase-like glycosyltransferase